MFNKIVLDAFKQNTQVDVIFNDFTKAFGCVHHSILMETLTRTGFENQ